VKSIQLTVRNEDGIHARPLGVFVETAGRFKPATKITVRNVTTGSPAKNATSALFVITIAAKKGHVIEVTADGAQEDEALAAIRDAVESGLGE
jgi:phosphotransferase system HPr (HPr) family protein